MAFVDFAQLKEKVRIEQVVSMLGLSMKQKGDQWRGPCPACKSAGDRALAVNISKQSYYCFGDGNGGDLIALCAHIQGTEAKDAAQCIDAHFRVTSTTPDSSPQPPSGLKPLDYLEHDHPAVEAVGFDSETAKALGIGYAKKGLMRGTVAIPVRLADGTLSGYIGITEATLPPKFLLPPS